MSTSILTTSWPEAKSEVDLLAALRVVRDRYFEASETVFAQRETYLEAVIAGDAPAAEAAKARLENAQSEMSAIAEVERQVEVRILECGVRPPAPDLRLLFRFFPGSGALRCTERCGVGR